jgi:hypothetical protein
MRIKDRLNIFGGKIPRLSKRAYFWIYLKIHSIFVRTSIALYNTENEILKADPNDLSEKDKKTTRMLHKNPLIEKFYAGQRDEKYVQDYYEILKKADKFILTSTPHEKAIATDKHLRFDDNYKEEKDEPKVEKDQYGRRYEHYGFFDDKHKHAGKTLGEVIALEFEERRTKDDDYELLYIFNNKPIEVGLVNIMDVLEKTEEENSDFEYKVVDVFQKSKQFQFPIKAVRDVEVDNKIEQLAEFLHVKKIGFDFRQLEFFIPLKFKTYNILDNSDLFNEIIKINNIFVKNDYGQMIGFGIIKFVKRIKYNDSHEVWKFEGIEMQNIKL